MEITAIVVAKANNRRLPGKNLLPFGDTTLIGQKVRTLRQCRRITKVLVGTDCPLIAQEAEDGGASVIERDDFHCNESVCSANEMIADICAKISTDVVVWAHCTNPLVLPETYDRAVEIFLGLGGKSLVSVSRLQDHLWYCGKPLNFDFHAVRHPLASELVPAYRQNGAIFIQNYKDMARNSYFYGDDPFLYEMGELESIDVNERLDYEMACLVHKRYFRPC